MRSVGEPSESPNETKEVLKILESVLASWGQAIADRIPADRLTEGIAKRPALAQIHVHTNRNAQNHEGFGEVPWRQVRRSQNLLNCLLRAGEMHETSSDRKIWT